jgi:hypothetical protein
MSASVADLVKHRGDCRGLVGLLARHEPSGGHFVVADSKRTSTGRVFLYDQPRDAPFPNCVDARECTLLDAWDPPVRRTRRRDLEKPPKLCRSQPEALPEGVRPS